jgi:SAM-dependent methyltransferase
MLEWTGERFLPWLEQPTIAYEHLHRYAYAAGFVRGKRVLDMASGEGYGSKMLSETASFVVGIDIDDNAVRHASDTYTSSKLQFLTGSIAAVPIENDHSFDVIVCFEAIEHIENQDELLKEVKRLLKADGIFIVSTPNKALYHEEEREENPFHVKELNFDEFHALLDAHFSSVQFLGQRVHSGSTMWPIGTTRSTGFEEFVIDRGENEYRFIEREKRIPLYFIGVASDSPLSAPQPSSVLIDHSDGLLREGKKAVAWREEKISTLETGLKWRQEQLEAREEQLHARDEAINWQEQQIGHLKEGLEQLQTGLEWTQAQLSNMSDKAASHEKALEWRAGQVETLEKEKSTLTTVLQSTQRRLNSTSQQLEEILASRAWKVVLKVRHVRDSLKALIAPGKSRG